MIYIQLSEDGKSCSELLADVSVTWSQDLLCAPSDLTPDQREQFRVALAAETAPPSFDAITQTCWRSGFEFVDDQWQTRWTVAELSADQIAANQRAARAAIVAQAIEAIKARRMADGIQAPAPIPGAIYAQLDEDGTYARDVPDQVDTVWDEFHQCRPSRLEPEEAEYFRVVQVAFVHAPDFDRITQDCLRNGIELVNGVWQTKWFVRDLGTSQAASNRAAAVQALETSIIQATQARLDAFAATRGYDGILSACTYATSAVPKFAGEGQYSVNARDSTWAALYQLLADVQAGRHATPSNFDDVEPLLPVLTWPA